MVEKRAREKDISVQGSREFSDCQQGFSQAAILWTYDLRIVMYYLQSYLSYIRGLPINDTPEIFGLHDNANISFAQNETFALLGAVLRLQPRAASSGGKAREEV